MNGSTAIAVIGLALISAWCDGKTRTIPNVVTLGGICCGIMLAWWHGNIVLALTGLLSACVLIWPYRKGWLGGGDVKLMMAYGTLLGPWQLLSLWIGAAILSLLAVFTMAWIRRQSLRSMGIPYAIPLAVIACWLAGKGWMP